MSSTKPHVSNTYETCSRRAMTNRSQLTACAQRHSMCRFVKTVIHKPTRTDKKVLTTFFSHYGRCRSQKVREHLASPCWNDSVNAWWFVGGKPLFCGWEYHLQPHGNDRRSMFSFILEAFPVLHCQKRLLCKRRTHRVIYCQIVLSAYLSASLKWMNFQWCLHTHCS